MIADPRSPVDALDAIARVVRSRRPVDVISGAPVSRGPFGQDEHYRPAREPGNGLIHELRPVAEPSVHETGRDVDGPWISRPVAQPAVGAGRRTTDRAPDLGRTPDRQPPMANISMRGSPSVAALRSSL